MKILIYLTILECSFSLRFVYNDIVSQALSHNAYKIKFAIDGVFYQFSRFSPCDLSTVNIE